MSPLDDRHAIATARELTYAAGIPLRDRYGFAVPDEDVLHVVRLVAAHTDDEAAANAIGAANMLGEIELASGSDTPIDEAYERRIVVAVRPVAAAAARRAAR